MDDDGEVVELAELLLEQDVTLDVALVLRQERAGGGGELERGERLDPRGGGEHRRHRQRQDRARAGDADQTAEEPPGARRRQTTLRRR
jgi:hypothetical protein